MKNCIVFSFSFLISLSIFLHLVSFSTGQLNPAESRILFQIQQQLEYPQVLQGWNNWTNFCYLPPNPSLSIVCSGNRITELTIIGNKSSPSKLPKPAPKNLAFSQHTLSQNFSIDSFFTVLTKLSNLEVLSLVSLGLWGPLPSKINRFWSLEVLNISSNFIYGEIPPSVARVKNLSSLVLADNLFNGSVPVLNGIQTLEEVDLGYNNLGPKFPSLGSNLVRVILRNNSIRSQIPANFIRFDRLQVLDVSSNNLVGPIPPSLFSLPSVQYLILSKNQLSGALSANVSCNDKLVYVDISENLLTGKLPQCLGSSNASRRVYSLWNCLSNATSKYQRPYSFCHTEALAVKPPEKIQDEKSTIKLGVVLGIVGGIIGVVGAIGLFILACHRRSQSRKFDEYKCDSFVFKKSSVHLIRGSPNAEGSQRHVPHTTRLASLLPPYHIFTLEDMEDATNSFDPSNLVGEGSQGQIYQGSLRDGSIVLVKCLKLRHKHSNQSLRQQMETISKLRHRNLVSVLGHCVVTYQDHPNISSTIFIVLEHVANGSLRDHLTDWRKKEVLKWPQRMAISIGIARGIQFLHTGVSSGLYGNDLKIENIMLDDTLTAKISNYNMTSPSKVGSESPLNGQGPSSLSSCTQYADKEDIYQLGIILLEIITGKRIKSTDELDETRLLLEKNLAEASPKLREAADPSIQGTFAFESLKTAVQITVNCLCNDPTTRPSIEDVLWHLQYAIQIQEGWASSGSGNLGIML